MIRRTYILGILLLLTTFGVLSQKPRNGGGNVDDLIKEVFGQDPATTPPKQPSTTTGQQKGDRGAGDGGTDIDKLIDDVLGGGGGSSGGNQQQPPGDLPSGNKDTRDVVDPNAECTCVPYYLCPNGSILTDGTGLLDIRAKPGACEEYMDFCCPTAPLDAEHPLKPVPIPRRGCGQRHPDGVGFRITGDNNNEAQFGEFPWMVALLKRTVLDDGTDLMVYLCGGALIHERVVLTAAHCVAGNPNDGAELLARVGEWDTQRTTEIYPHQNVKVAKVIVHPAFKRNNLWNDFALLILEQPGATLGENVDTVCLPSPGVVPLSRECYATGWGKDKFDEDEEVKGFRPWLQRRQLHIPILSGLRRGVERFLESLHIRDIVGSVWPNSRRRSPPTPGGHGGGGLARPRGEKGTYQVILKKIDLPIVTKDQCITLLRKTRLGPFYRLHDSFVCAGGIPGKDTCKGDGGSPLVCPMEGRQGSYEVTGLVAWGIGCGDETPGVYAGVAYARQWIDQELNNQGIRLE